MSIEFNAMELRGILRENTSSRSQWGRGGRWGSKNSKCCQPDFTSLDPTKGRLRSLLKNPIGVNPGQGSSPFSLSPQIQTPKVGSCGFHSPSLSLAPVPGCWLWRSFKRGRGHIPDQRQTGLGRLTHIVGPWSTLTLAISQRLREATTVSHFLLDGWFTVSVREGFMNVKMGQKLNSFGKGSVLAMLCSLLLCLSWISQDCFWGL